MIRLLPLIGVLASVFIVTSVNSSFSRIQDSEQFFQSPPGYEGFCERNPKLCADGETKVIPYSRELIKTLTEVNTRINMLPHVYDSTNNHSKDYWGVINIAGGDCEDYAARKKEELIDLGLPADSLRFVFLTTDTHGKIHAHVVLAIKTDHGDLILDNLREEIYFKEQYTNYNWLLEEATVDRWRILNK